MQATIHNEFLTLTVDTHGAEAVSLKNAAGEELLWQADPAVWKRHAPILFPWTSKLPGGTFEVDGKTYKGGQHGFARDMEHTLLKAEGDTIPVSYTHLLQRGPCSTVHGAGHQQPGPLLCQPDGGSLFRAEAAVLGHIALGAVQAGTPVQPCLHLRHVRPHACLLYTSDFIANSTGVPRCTECGGIVKPDVVLYEEGLDEEVLDVYKRQRVWSPHPGPAACNGSCQGSWKACA